MSDRLRANQVFFMSSGEPPRRGRSRSVGRLPEGEAPTMSQDFIPRTEPQHRQSVDDDSLRPQHLQSVEDDSLRPKFAPLMKVAFGDGVSTVSDSTLVSSVMKVWEAIQRITLPSNATQVLSYIANYEALLLAHPLYVSHAHSFESIFHQIVRLISVSTTSDIALPLSISVALTPFEHGPSMMQQLSSRLKEVSFPSSVRSSLVQDHYTASNALSSLHIFQQYRERVIIIRDLGLLSDSVVLASICSHVDRVCSDPHYATLRVKWSVPEWQPRTVNDAFAQIFAFLQQYPPPQSQAFSAAAQQRFVSPVSAKTPIATKTSKLCDDCGKPGHSTATCFKTHKCDMCGALPGHLSFRCPKYIAKHTAKVAVVLGTGLGSSGPEMATVENHVSSMATAHDQSVDWTVDSGTSGGMIPDRADLDNYVSFPAPGQPVRIADKTVMFAAGCGDATLSLDLPPVPATEFRMLGVLHVPTLADPLMSMRNLCENGYGYVCAPDSTGQPEHRIFLAKDPSVTSLLHVKGGVPFLKATVLHPSRPLSNEVASAAIAQAKHVHFPLEVAAQAASSESQAVDSVYSISEEGATGATASVAALQPSVTLSEFHISMGHLNYADCLLLATQCGIELSARDESFCESCVLAKQRRASIPKMRSPDSPVPELGEVWHVDIVPIEGASGLTSQSFAIVYIEEKSRYTFLYFMSAKNGTVATLDQLFIDVLKVGITIPKGALLQTDVDSCVATYGLYRTRMAHYGMVLRTSPPHSQAMNGLVERSIGVLKDMARAMLIASKLGKRFWPAAMRHAVWLKNRCSTTTLPGSVSPYQFLFGTPPDVARVLQFGVEAFVHIENQQRQASDPKSRKGWFVGYSDTNPGCKVVFDGIDQRYTEVESIHVVVNGNKLTAIDPPIEIGASLDVSMDVVPEVVIPDSEVAQTKMVSSPEIAPCWLLSASASSSSSTQAPFEIEGVGDTVFQIREPASLHASEKLPNSKGYADAFEREMTALEANRVWRMVPLSSVPRGTTIVRPITVFTTKYDSNGVELSKKARIVADGSRQRPGIDYGASYAPVAMSSTVRMLVATATLHNFETHHVDFGNAFLNGDLEIPAYMYPPETVPKLDANGDPQVCELLKALYGLSQAPRIWYEVLHKALFDLGFVRSEVDPCLYTHSEYLWLAIHVDDLIITGKVPKRIKALKDALAARFNMKDLGLLSFHCGITYERDMVAGTTKMHQHQYILDVLARFGMLNCAPQQTPAQDKEELFARTSTELPLSPEAHRILRAAHGCLQFLQDKTRPDIANAVHQVACQLADPCLRHWQATKRILRYLAGTSNRGLTYRRDPGTLADVAHPSHLGSGVVQVSVDANWGANLDNRRSKSGFVATIAGAALSWTVELQKSVALSSCEAELMALSKAVAEAMHLRQLIASMKFSSPLPMLMPGSEISFPMQIWEDNQGTIHVVTNPSASARMKHVDIRYHYVREQVEAKNVTISYIPTEHQMADGLTKSLGRLQFVKFSNLVLGSAGLVFESGQLDLSVNTSGLSDVVSSAASFCVSPAVPVGAVGADGAVKHAIKGVG